MNLAKTIDNPAASRPDLEAAKQELVGRLKHYDEERAKATGKAESVAVSAAPEKGITAVVAEIQGLDLLIDGAKSALEGVGGRIAALLAEEARSELAARRTKALSLLAERDVEIDEAEKAVMLAAKHIKNALELSRQAILAFPGELTIVVASEIREGMLLIPALTQRFWWQLGYKHPLDIRLDNLHAHKVGPLSKVFEFEHKTILNAPTTTQLSYQEEE